MCKTGSHIVFCSREPHKKPIIHYKNAKRWRKKNPPSADYTWTLSKYVGTLQSMMEGLMFEPSNKLGKDLDVNWVLQEINNRNCFDFEYTPTEGDCLHIRTHKSCNFLSYIFQEGKWEIGMHNTFYTETEDIHEGEVKIVEDES